ncbi:class I adenylate-forming enzyme family protein [Cryptosporangium aurantiacum]|uniref:Long-chain acyl-CoA synthetase n=1 Tax=Cryptosporangium aurantiacum TaxID=134849 RepID=A0A1M7QBJ5_9ACTN|nr:AMP-binding protein [Cryptosporangium aurantiacum]SHN28020.1 long-chain acyl-CoA synthetase [Cryptosporangium aurantiacum]
MTDVHAAPVTAPTGSTLSQLVERSWERIGEGMLIFEDQRWTHAELGARARRFATGLRESGLRPGDRVVVCMANCPEVGVAYHGTWWAGGATTPVLFLLSESEIAHVLRDSEAAFVITTPEFLPKVQTAAQGVPTVRGIVVAGALPAAAAGPAPGAAGGTAAGPAPGLPAVLDFAQLESAAESPQVARQPSDLAGLLYTGGTTGRSKGVMLTHDAMSAAAWAMTHASEQDDDLRVALLPLPLSHVYGLTVSVMAVHAATPRTSVLMRWFDPVGWLRLAEEHRAQVSAVVPSMLQLIMTQPMEDYDLSALRRIASGGAPLPAQVAEDFKRRVPGVEIHEGYGCSELAGGISAAKPGTQRPGSVGVAMPNVEVRIERPDGTVADPGEDGEICARGPMLMTAYWNSPEETAYALRDGWFHTGDIGHQDADGHLYVVDRIKDLIIRDGFNVYPRDVEEAMLTHPDVALCAVVGRPDPRRGEEVVAFVQLRPGASATTEDLVAYGRSQLAAVKYPRDVRIVDAIPLTSVGKLDRKALRRTV